MIGISVIGIHKRYAPYSKNTVLILAHEIFLTKARDAVMNLKVVG